MAQHGLPDISFRDITGTTQYAYGKLIDITIIIKKSNGYVNATKMCLTFVKMFGKKAKGFSYWKSNKGSKKYIAGFCEEHELDENEWCYEKTAGGNALTRKLAGSYVHPKMIVVIAMWCSSDFGNKVTGIVMEYSWVKALE